MILVTHDGSPEWEVAERCCFCRRPTRYWFTPKDVACCQECAGTRVADEVPDKTVWLASERAADDGIPAWWPASLRHQGTPNRAPEPGRAAGMFTEASRGTR